MFRTCLASVARYGFNHFITRVPSRRFRRIVLRRYLANLGDDCSIQMGVRFLHAPKVSLGSRVIINFDCLLDGRHYPILIGDDVSVGPAATILTLGHDPQSADFQNKGGPVTIGSRAWIAYGAVILPNVSIGDGAVVAAGAVVSRDIPAYTIAAGVPAQVVAERNRDLTYSLRYDPWLC